MSTITKEQTFDRDESYGCDIKITQKAVYQSTSEMLELNFGNGSDSVFVPVTEFRLMVSLVKETINSK